MTTKIVLDDAINFAEFATKMQELAPLLTERNIKNLIKGVDEAKEIIATKNEVEAATKAAEKVVADLDKRQQAIIKQAADTDALNKQAALTLAEAKDAKVAADRDRTEAANGKKHFEEALVKTQSAEKKASDKAMILDEKIKEMEAKSKELSESIANYNAAVSNLKAVKVA